MAKIAIIGTGIAGLASAWILSKEHAVTVYEQNDYVGGHTNTRPAAFGEKTVYADTGFMVFNQRTYPNMVKMFKYLDIETVKTDMAFGVSAKGGAFEFTSDNVFEQKRNLLLPSYWKMLLDIVRFNRTVEAVIAKHEDEFPLKDLLTEMQMGDRFQKEYLLPMTGAIWSTNKQNMSEYPAKRFVAFLNNHGLLSPKSINPFRMNEGTLQWYTVKGGSNEYIQKILSLLNAEVRLSCGVTKITRVENTITIEDETGTSEEFDHVVCASHPDQSLSMLQAPSDDERASLETFVYSKNEAYMHKDTSFMMKHAKNWPSWTYSESAEDEVEISYYMNRLQAIDKQYPVIVTLNPTREIATEDIFFHTVYEHPQFSIDTTLAQENIKALQGANNTWYAGAWLGHGFHEDGLRSALAIGKGFGVTAPWEA